MWVLDVSGQSLWKVNRNGRGALIGSWTTSLNSGRYDYDKRFYFDTARRTPVLLVSHYDYASDADTGLFLHAWTGSSFEPIVQTNGVRSFSSDAFVFDPRREVLVHFVAPQGAHGPGPDALTVREMGIDGVWRDIGTPLPEKPTPDMGGRQELCAGWEERRGLAVFVDCSYRDLQTWGWDGKKWHKLDEAFPEYPWRPYTMTTAPKTGGLVYLHEERSTTKAAFLWELTDEGWQKKDADHLEAFASAAYDASSDTCFVYAPWFGPGTVRTVLGVYDGTKLEGVGAQCPYLTHGGSGGHTIFWGFPGGNVGNRAREVVRRYQVPQVFELEGDALKQVASPPSVFDIVTAEPFRRAVGFAGEVYALEAGAWTKIAEPIVNREGAYFFERDTTNLGGDPAGRILLVGGEPVDSSKRLTDTWLFDETWTCLTTKGTAPTALGSSVHYDAGRGVWVLVGGRLKSYKANEKVFEFDGTKWSSFPNASDIRQLAWDPVSAQLIAVDAGGGGDEEGPSLSIYRGTGAFAHIAKLPFETYCLAYDSHRRAFVARTGDGTILEAQVGVLLDAAKLDALSSPAAATELKPSKATKNDVEAAAPAVVGKTAFEMKFGRKGDDLFGGMPPGTSSEEWPVCEDCAHPMAFIVLVHAHKERLPLRKHAALALFLCGNVFSDGSCETWDPDAGCNAVRLLSKKDLARAALPRAPSSPSGEKPSAKLKSYKISYAPIFEADRDANENEEDPKALSKLGGYPVWLQGETPPTCSTCAVEMTFAGQLREVVDKMNFAGGDGYLFYCPDEHGAKFLWQH